MLFPNSKFKQPHLGNCNFFPQPLSVGPVQKTKKKKEKPNQIQSAAIRLLLFTVSNLGMMVISLDWFCGGGSETWGMSSCRVMLWSLLMSSATKEHLVQPLLFWCSAYVLELERVFYQGNAI